MKTEIGAAAADLVLAGQLGPVGSDRAWPSVARFGPFFALADADGGDRWQPLRSVVTDPQVLTMAVRAAAVAIGTAGQPVELRAAGSTQFFGLAARLISPILGWSATSGSVPLVDLDTLVFAADRPPLAQLGCRAVVRLRTPDRAIMVGALRTVLVNQVLTPLVTAYSDHCHLSTRVLWGNVAAAMVAAAGQISAVSPPAGQLADFLTRRLLDLAPLVGHGSWRESGSNGREQFVRNNCCLYYRLPSGGLCADCVLAPSRPHSERHP